VNIENLSPAMTKAIEAEGTTNAILGNALVKRGIMEKVDGRFILTMEYVKFANRDADEDEPTREMGPVEAEEEVRANLIDDSTISFMQDRDRIADETRLRLITDAKRDIEEAGRALAELNLPAVDVEKVKFEIETARNFLEGETPWEASRHAKRTAEMWARVVRLRSEFADAPDWRKERITVALATMGTVVYPEGTPEHEKYGQDLTAALSEWKTTGEERWVIEFRRIGRVENPKPLYVACFERPDALAEKIHRYAAKFLTSRSFEVDVNILGASGTVLIEGGRFGEGTIRKE
jgi:hypothetical protein